jgi:hypothetical protein
MGTLENGKRSGSAIYFYDHGFGSVMTSAQITNSRVSLKQTRHMSLSEKETNG